TTRLSRTTFVQWPTAGRMLKFQLTRISAAKPALHGRCTAARPMPSKPGGFRMTATATVQVAAAASVARPTKAEARQPKALPTPNGDFYQIAETLSANEQAILKNVRDFMEAKVAPIINDYWVRDAFPFELIPALKELNIGGLNVEDHSSKLKGLVA